MYSSFHYLLLVWSWAISLISLRFSFLTNNGWIINVYSLSQESTPRQTFSRNAHPHFHQKERRRNFIVVICIVIPKWKPKCLLRVEKWIHIPWQIHTHNENQYCINSWNPMHLLFLMMCEIILRVHIVQLY